MSEEIEYSTNNNKHNNRININISRDNNRGSSLDDQLKIRANFNTRELRRRSRSYWKWGMLVAVVFGLVDRNLWGLFRNLGYILETIKTSIMEIMAT